MLGRSIVAAAAALLCTAACASQQAGSQHAASGNRATKGVASANAVAPSPLESYETETATPAAPTGAFAHPPDTPCVYPADESLDVWDPSFVGILQESDLVVEADVEDKFQRLTEVGDQVYWSQLVDNVDVVRSRGVPPPTVTGLDVEGDPGKPPYGWTPGRYILLLFGIQNGVSSISAGMAGMFRIVDGQALRFCPNYDDPAHPIAASGTPPTVDELLALIPTELPLDSVAPKPTTAPSSP